MSRPVKKTPTGRGDRIIPPLGGLCEIGLRPGAALPRGQSNSEIGADNQELASKDSQNPFSALDTDLQTVISAWDKLPSSLKAAVVAIVSSSHSG
jgi:hypothetical protein